MLAGSTMKYGATRIVGFFGCLVGWLFGWLCSFVGWLFGVVGCLVGLVGMFGLVGWLVYSFC